MHPELLSVALLDEIAERLLTLETLSKERRPEGFVDTFDSVAVTDQVRELSASHNYPWFTIMIVNDGPDDVWVLVNPRKNPTPHRVAVGEPYNVDMKRGVIRQVNLWCDAGETATVRVVGLR